MVFRRFFVFPTFVLACCVLAAPAYAAKSTSAPNLDDTQEATAPPENEKEIRSSIDIAAPPPPRPVSAEEKEYFYRYRSALTFQTGLVYDTRAVNDGTSFLTRLGTQYDFTTEDRRKYEGGADLLSDGSGSLEGFQRFVFGQGRFRPYVKGGLGLRVVPADQLATFLKYENYQLRGAAGLEQLVKDPIGLRVELEAMLSSRSLGLSLLFGGVFAW